MSALCPRQRITSAANRWGVFLGISRLRDSICQILFIRRTLLSSPPHARTTSREIRQAYGFRRYLSRVENRLCSGDVLLMGWKHANRSVHGRHRNHGKMWQSPGLGVIFLFRQRAYSFGRSWSLCTTVIAIVPIRLSYASPNRKSMALIVRIPA